MTHYSTNALLFSDNHSVNLKMDLLTTKIVTMSILGSVSLLIGFVPMLVAKKVRPWLEGKKQPLKDEFFVITTGGSIRWFKRWFRRLLPLLFWRRGDPHHSFDSHAPRSQPLSTVQHTAGSANRQSENL